MLHLNAEISMHLLFSLFSLSVGLVDITGWFMKEPANNPVTLWGLSHILAELFPLRRLHTGQYPLFLYQHDCFFHLSRDNWQNVWLDVTAMKWLSSYIYHTAAFLEKCIHDCMFQSIHALGRTAVCCVKHAHCSKITPGAYRVGWWSKSALFQKPWIQWTGKKETHHSK